MRAPAILTTLLGALALVFVGCGGSDGGAAAGEDAAASVIPARAVGYVSVNSDLESAQWERVKALAEKFPGRDRAVAALLKELSDEGLDWKRDVEPAVGPEVAIAVLLRGDDARVVWLTQPDDEAKLKALAAKSDDASVTREIEDWWVVAETDADLDLFEQARDGGALADDDTYQTAVADLPDESVATFYVDGEALTPALEREAGGNFLSGSGRFVWAAGALEALEDGAKLSGRVRTENAGDLGRAYTPELLERVPARSLAVLSFNNVGEGLEQLRSNAFTQQFVPQAEQMLGVTLAELGDLFGGEGALYVRQGAPIPEISLALGVSDEAKALATIDKLAQRVAPLVEGRSGTTTVDGVSAKYLEIQGVRVTYATFDGLLFVTSGPNGIAEFRSEGDKIGDDDAFTRTKEAAGLGDQTSGFFYVNLQDAIGLIQGFAGIAGESVPPDVAANLAPLDTLLVQGSRDGDEATFAGFVGIR
jgi:hypothetical protein